MIVLGFDSTAPTLTVGIADSGKTLGRWDSTPDRHRGDALDSLIDRALADIGRTRADIQGLTIVTGPGSLTATRIGWATACGWALASRIPITGWTVPEVQRRRWLQCDALPTDFAQQVKSAATVFCLVHHRRQEFYCYQLMPDGPVQRPDVINLSDWHPVSNAPVVFLGPGLLTHQDRWIELFGSDVLLVPVTEAVIGGDLLALWGAEALAQGRHFDPESSPLDYGLPPTFRKAS